MEITLAIVVFLFGLACLFLISKKAGISFAHLGLGWFIKLAYSICYVYIFTTYYGEGDRIQGDSLNFLEDGRVVNEFAQGDPAGYLKLLIGVDGSEAELLNGPLANTKIWDAGENGDFMNDNRLIIRINSIIHFFSGGSVYVHTLLFSLIGCFGLIFIYITFRDFIAKKKLFLAALFITPSIGFWGSGLTKESIMLFSIGLFLWALVKITTQKFHWATLLFLFVGAFLCLINKPYAGLVLISISTVIVFGKFLHWKKFVLLIYSGLIILTAVGLSYAPEKINLVEKISYKQKDVTNLAKGGVFFVTDSSFCAFDHSYLSHFDTLPDKKIKVKETTTGESKLFGQNEFVPFTIYPSDSIYDVYLIIAPSTSYFETTPIAYRGLNLLLTIPECLFNTMLRPFPTDSGSPMKYLIFLQNLAFVAFGVFVFFRRKKLSDYERYLIYTFVVSSLIILLVVGWTTPVFGAIVRYKVPVDLFLLISLFILFNPAKKTNP